VDLRPLYEARTGRVLVFAALDNLVKGMAGQAVQNLNLMLGLPEDLALPKEGLWP
jgi:N-acetyl-gamma-glutamyl-phosphate reductase